MKPTRRIRKAYRITARGDARLQALLLEDTPGDEDRSFALRLAFCRHLEPAARLALLERRRAVLASRLDHARRAGDARGDRYLRSLVEHRAQSIQRDLEWVDSLVAAERRALTEPSIEPSLPIGSDVDHDVVRTIQREGAKAS